MQAVLTQRVVAVCSHLRALRDFRTLKTLVSAVRAIAGQTSITGISWKVQMRFVNQKPLKGFSGYEPEFLIIWQH